MSLPTPFVPSRLYTPSVLICPYVPPIFACPFVRLPICVLPYLSTRYWNSIDNSDEVLDFHMRIGFQLRKNTSNLKRFTIIKIGLLSRITLIFTKGMF